MVPLASHGLGVLIAQAESLAEAAEFEYENASTDFMV
jgi:hypothetical protein